MAVRMVAQRAVASVETTAAMWAEPTAVGRAAPMDCC
jgi:hypothetical protein